MNSQIVYSLFLSFIPGSQSLPDYKLLNRSIKHQKNKHCTNDDTFSLIKAEGSI